MEGIYDNMNVGLICIAVAFLSALCSTVLFFVNGQGERLLKQQSGQSVAFLRLTAQSWSDVSLGASILASTLLLCYLLGHQFQHSYVAKYSSRSLPILYTISAFWAGQEGTFLLWALFIGLMSLAFTRKSNPIDNYAMAIISGFSAFLYLLLVVKSPFEVTAGSPPPDGSGMNPLLQDPWMAIHPPLLFAGYAATVFPFALVLSALLQGKNERWFKSGFGWSLFATLSLGTGIIIGGFWAYEVLGWGGFWGWDPVENSSLVPWLMLLALIHGLLVQKTKGALVRLNMLFAILSFLLVIYATFLTRSGVLSDFSVHSFTDLGINNYLVGMMVLSVVVSFGLFIAHFRTIHAPTMSISALNREVALLLGMAVFAASAAFTFVGMSSPIITKLFGKASQVDTSFYNTVNMPIAIGIGILLGITPFLGWTGEEKPGSFLKRLSMPFLLTALSIAIALVGGVHSGLQIALIAASTFGLTSNVIIAFRQYRSGWTNLGGPLAHIGAALLFIGIIGSGAFDESVRLSLQPGKAQSAFGYQFTFRNIDTSSSKTRVLIDVSDGRTSFTATPRLYFSDYNQEVMREPDIKILPLKDLYISPIEMESPPVDNGGNPQLELAKGESKELNGYDVQFVQFETGGHGQPGKMTVGALLDVQSNGQHTQITPEMEIDEQGHQTFIAADLPASGYAAQKHQVRLTAMSVEDKKILLAFDGFSDQNARLDSHTLVIDVTSKPLMMVVWTGVLLIIGGTTIAFVRRTKRLESATL
jgi:cytochrome c-type biogenesis protein CcmF